MTTAGANDLEVMELAKARDYANAEPSLTATDSETDRSSQDAGHGRTPTEEEMQTLRRVSGHVPWQAYSIAFVELCERFSYYGTTAVFVNFIQRPLPPGSTTGAIVDGQPGALGMGQRASTGLTLFNAFWSYVMPLLGAYMADQYWGRYLTIQVSIAIALVGHVILIISAIPSVIVNPGAAIACFAIGIVIMGVGVGGFKSNISPLIAEQYTETKMYVKELKTGERVIVDPAATIARIYLYYYLMINIGAVTGSTSMVFAERYVGFWLSFFLPTVMFLFCPLVMFLCRNKYTLTPPTGSVMAQSWRLVKFAMKGQWSFNPVTLRRNISHPDFWNKVKPSNLAVRPAWMNFDDEWVDEVRRGLKACAVFLYLPIYWLAYGQWSGNLTSQAATMTLNGAPNDVVSNLNPLFIIFFIPVMDRLIYPALRKMGFNFTPIKRITVGFFFASAAMISSCVTQYYIYTLSPCGYYANTCDSDSPAPISVWLQVLPYGLIGISEIFASVTSLEYAFTKAPKNMRSTVTAISLLMNAISSALAQALVALSEDPLLVWNYGVVAVLAAIAGVAFFFNFRKLDAEEDQLNALKVSKFEGRRPADVEDRRVEQVHVVSEK